MGYLRAAQMVGIARIEVRFVRCAGEGLGGSSDAVGVCDVLNLS